MSMHRRLRWLTFSLIGATILAAVLRMPTRATHKEPLAATSRGHRCQRRKFGHA